MKRRVIAVFLLFFVATVAAEETVYVTRTGTKYHRVSCRHLAKSAIPMTLSEAASRYSPCSQCNPPVLDRVTSSAATPLPSTNSSTSVPSDLPSLEAEKAGLERQVATMVARIQLIDARIAELRRGAGSSAPVSAPVIAPSSPRPASPSYSGRCQATTRKGTQCTRQAKAGSRYCWQHGG